MPGLHYFGILGVWHSSRESPEEEPEQETAGPRVVPPRVVPARFPSAAAPKQAPAAAPKQAPAAAKQAPAAAPKQAPAPQPPAPVIPAKAAAATSEAVPTQAALPVSSQTLFVFFVINWVLQSEWSVRAIFLPEVKRKNPSKRARDAKQRKAEAETVPWPVDSGMSVDLGSLLLKQFQLSLDMWGRAGIDP